MFAERASNVFADVRVMKGGVAGGAPGVLRGSARERSEAEG